jgi:hypothetical protein
MKPNDAAAQTQLIAQVERTCIEPAYVYFNGLFNEVTGELREAVKLFKAAQMCDPRWAARSVITPAMVDQLANYPILNKGDTIAKLKEELPAYQARVVGIDQGPPPPTPPTLFCPFFLFLFPFPFFLNFFLLLFLYII